MWDIHTYDSVDSTNRIVKDALAQGCAEGFAACAFEQTQGYGRQGRMWKSPRGGLYLSFALRPANTSQEQVASIGPAMGLAVAQALQTLVPDADVRVKWPNDVMLDSAKLAGISAERMSDGGVCIGVGVNVFVPKGVGTRQMGRYKAAYLAEEMSPSCHSEERSPLICHSEERSHLCHSEERSDEESLLTLVRDTILQGVNTTYEIWRTQGFAALQSSFQTMLYGAGEHTALELIDGTPFVQGIVEGISPQARLLVRDAHDKLHQVSSGEVHTR